METTSSDTRILTVNAGSSSIKLALFAAHDTTKKVLEAADNLVLALDDEDALLSHYCSLLTAFILLFAHHHQLSAPAYRLLVLSYIHRL